MTTSVGQGQGEELERLQQRVEHLEHERKHLLAVIEILQETIPLHSLTRRLWHAGSARPFDRCSIFLMERGGQTVRPS
jgi:hypothetical protein